MTTTTLTQSDLEAMVDELVGAGVSVIAPVPVGRNWERTEFQPIRVMDEATLGGGLPRGSLTRFFRDGEEGRDPSTPQVILGARPCDAAGIETLDDLMARDQRDEPWFARRAATAIVSVACGTVDASCFCTAVGLAPDARRGSDVLLFPLAGSWGPPPSERRTLDLLRQAVDMYLLDCEPYPGAAEAQQADAPRPGYEARYLAEAVTSKGEALLAARGAASTAEEVARARSFARDARRTAATNPAVLRLRRKSYRFDRELEAKLGMAAADGGELVERTSPLLSEQLPSWIAHNTEHALWDSLASRCLHCSTCLDVCSTAATCEAKACHAEESTGAGFCSRVVNKFCVHPSRFDGVLCTGCGRCNRVCGAGMNLPDTLAQLVELAAGAIPSRWSPMAAHH
jgi:ferredoxin